MLAHYRVPGIVANVGLLVFLLSSLALFKLITTLISVMEEVSFFERMKTIDQFVSLLTLPIHFDRFFYILQF